MTFKPNEVETYNFMYTNITMDNTKFPRENIPKFNIAKNFKFFQRSLEKNIFFKKEIL